MLVQFTFGNFRSFRDRATLSMVAASKLQADPDLDARNVFLARERPRLELLRAAALYGANASGKSNIILALDAFITSVAESANIGYSFPPQYFWLNNYSENEPAFYEIVFLDEGIQYRYGFEVIAQTEHKEIVSEWLYQATSSVESLLFERENNQIKRGRRFSEGSALLDKGMMRRKQSLFLSLNAQLGEPICTRIVHHILNRIGAINAGSDVSAQAYKHDTADYLEEGRYRDAIMRLIRGADTGITDINVLEKEDPHTAKNDLPFDLPRILSVHPVFDKVGKQIDAIPFPMEWFESQGTRKLFSFAGPILNALDCGDILFVDEMDARFHPLLTQALIELFQSSESNPKNAQLIFITHDTNLLDPRRFRRDQIWFVEKDRLGASHLYSLADFKGVRKDAPFEENYIQGRYGAIPFIGGMSRLFEEDLSAVSDTTSDSQTAHAKA